MPNRKPSGKLEGVAVCGSCPTAVTIDAVYVVTMGYIQALPDPPRPEYPRPRFRRRHWTNLNGEWRFGFDRPNFDRSIIVPFAYQSPLSGIGERTLHDVVWYRRLVRRPPGERLLLHFGAVDYVATVLMNGAELARHEGGHTPFTIDVTDSLGAGENELVVKAEDPGDQTLPRGKQFWKERPEGIFYTATTGIWQSVWLEPVSDRHVAGLRLLPRLQEGALDFELSTSDADTMVELEARLGDRPIGRWQGQPGLGRMPLETIAPWTPETPALYDLTVRLLDHAKRELDRIDTYFGLRVVDVRDGRFLLNGEPYVQRLVLDQGYFPGGWYTAATDADLRRDIELAKGFGFNGARKHQKIEDPRWHYWADRLGFLVWSEMPNFHQHSAEAERRLLTELAAVIDRDCDHPCIVAWVPMNESFGLQASLSNRKKANFLIRLYQLVHQLDGSRPVVSNDGWEHALTDLCTVHDYGRASDLRRRYRTLAAALDPAGRPHPLYLPGFDQRGEPLLVTEFGGVAMAGQGGWGYAEAAGPQDLVQEVGDLVDALMAAGPVEGFCYTQLADVEQERNGLLTFDRRPKVDPSVLKPVTQTAKRR